MTKFSSLLALATLTLANPPIYNGLTLTFKEQEQWLSAKQRNNEYINKLIKWR